MHGLVSLRALNRQTSTLVLFRSSLRIEVMPSVQACNMAAQNGGRSLSD